MITLRNRPSSRLPRKPAATISAATARLGVCRYDADWAASSEAMRADYEQRDRGATGPTSPSACRHPPLRPRRGRPKYDANVEKVRSERMGNREQARQDIETSVETHLQVRPTRGIEDDEAHLPDYACSLDLATLAASFRLPASPSPRR